MAVDVDPALRRLVETGPFYDIAPLLDRRELEVGRTGGPLLVQCLLILLP